MSLGLQQRMGGAPSHNYNDLPIMISFSAGRAVSPMSGEIMAHHSGSPAGLNLSPPEHLSIYPLVLLNLTKCLILHNDLSAMTCSSQLINEN